MWGEAIKKTVQGEVHYIIKAEIKEEQRDDFNKDGLKKPHLLGATDVPAFPRPSVSDDSCH